mgnify:CR=1 FL=1
MGKILYNCPTKNLDEFKINDVGESLSISYIENQGVCVLGNFKVVTFNSEIVNLKTRKSIVEIKGEK